MCSRFFVDYYNNDHVISDEIYRIISKTSEYAVIYPLFLMIYIFLIVCVFFLIVVLLVGIVVNPFGPAQTLKLPNGDGYDFDRASMAKKLQKEKLRQIILKHFDEEEIVLLCSDLEESAQESGYIEFNMNFDRYIGKKLEYRVHLLVGDVQKKQAIPHLINEIVKQRPFLREELIKEYE